MGIELIPAQMFTKYLPHFQTGSLLELSTGVLRPITLYVISGEGNRISTTIHRPIFTRPLMILTRPHPRNIAI
ncbi:unnamed protein product [Bursaphelenchus xylophilus]|uniref:(pine wood nematode) hypothetical protein n=1 Tax=Bursaphelenchus xylophilus TaxID=6326 RepID=A0A7I8XJJ4_BURXY|nr:unnamed protein product [Bursaphelenchus xylophilus]CAG9121452.1 unnamed protein product [Bursaphelenchus xylophilus]